MQFQVPQFIESEDKIIGPLTIKQFGYLLIGGSLSFVTFFFLNPIPWVIFTVVTMTIFSVFTFMTVNGRPLSTVAFAAFAYYWKPKMYIWKKGAVKQAELNVPVIEERAQFVTGARSMLNRLMDQIKTSKNPLPEREKTIAPSILDRTKSSKERFEMMRKITGDKEMARRVDYK